MKNQFMCFLGTLILFVSSCTAPVETPAKLDMDKLKMEIQKMEDAYAAAEKSKDAAGVAAYYSDDAISYNREEEPTSGKAAIQERISQRLSKDTTGNTNVYKVVDLYAEGNMAVEVGSWTVIDTAGKSVDNGHYISYFENRNGKYQCVRDMNVSSKPKVASN